MDGTFSLIAAIRAIFDPDNGLSEHERIVAACLCRHADAWGESFPSVATIARECAISQNTARRALAGLERAGWLAVVRRDGRTAVYRLTPSPQGGVRSPQVQTPATQAETPSPQGPLHHREGTPSPQGGVSASGEPEVIPTEVAQVDDSPRTSYSENHHASGQTGPQRADELTQPPTNSQLIGELGDFYRQVVPKKLHQKGDYAFIGRLYNDFGYDRVYEAINELAYVIEAGRVPERPLPYLRRILAKDARASPRPKNLVDYIPYEPFEGRG